MVSEKFLLIGLGNPGREYRFNRHNVGFMTLDRAVERHKLMAFTKKLAQTGCMKCMATFVKLPAYVAIRLCLLTI